MSEDYQLVDKILDVPFTTSDGMAFMMGSIKTQHRGVQVEHALVYKGAINAPREPILLRINSACYTGDIFDCQRCDCHWQLEEAKRMIHREGGLIIYHLHHEGNAAGFTNKLKTYQVMDQQKKTMRDAYRHLSLEPDQRRYFSSSLILSYFGIKRVKLMTNNMGKRDILVQNGIEVSEVIPIVSQKQEHRDYLQSKRDQYGHVIQFGCD
jgi:3,4-dihydroxy 2-butanone 4-phosphate synthase/GTP cyclohydrolase II